GVGVARGAHHGRVDPLLRAIPDGEGEDERGNRARRGGRRGESWRGSAGRGAILTETSAVRPNFILDRVAEAARRERREPVETGAAPPAVLPAPGVAAPGQLEGDAEFGTPADDVGLHPAHERGQHPDRAEVAHLRRPVHRLAEWLPAVGVIRVRAAVGPERDCVETQVRRPRDPERQEHHVPVRDGGERQRRGAVFPLGHVNRPVRDRIGTEEPGEGGEIDRAAFDPEPPADDVGRGHLAGEMPLPVVRGERLQLAPLGPQVVQQRGRVQSAAVNDADLHVRPPWEPRVPSTQSPDPGPAVRIPPPRTSQVTPMTARLAILSAVALGFLCPDARAEEPPRPLNILFLLGDDWRWDTLGCAGNPVVKTPHLDALAADGVRFTQCRVTTSLCCTSPATLLSGQHMARHTTHRFGVPLSPEAFARTYPAILKANGYWTGFVGKFGVGKIPDGGFDFQRSYEGVHWMPDGAGGKIHVTEKNARDTLEVLKDRPKDKTFCLSVSFFAPHDEDRAPEQYPPQP